eukprot:3169724-Amphidinium_carterae.2
MPTTFEHRTTWPHCCVEACAPARWHCSTVFSQRVHLQLWRRHCGKVQQPLHHHHHLTSSTPSRDQLPAPPPYPCPVHNGISLHSLVDLINNKLPSESIHPITLQHDQDLPQVQCFTTKMAHTTIELSLCFHADTKRDMLALRTVPRLLRRSSTESLDFCFRAPATPHFTLPSLPHHTFTPHTTVTTPHHGTENMA